MKLDCASVQAAIKGCFNSLEGWSITEVCRLGREQSMTRSVTTIELSDVIHANSDFNFLGWKCF